MKFKDWVPSLSDQQVRALASQSGVHGALTGDIDKLRGRVLDSERPKEIFEENYGEKASVQNES